jgi:putative spermidine/putrescine transport system ATP-binding protein
MFLRVASVSKQYRGQKVLDDISFPVRQGELVSLIGPSGAGKTTLLKIIAGLELPDSGSVKSTADLCANPAILVFQDYLLFPAMTVFNNVAYGLKCRGVKGTALTEKVSAMLAYFQLTDKSRHYPRQLSAGQQQRVALARAMVVNPSLLLLDEPFANLDRNLKAETAEFIKTFQKEYGITAISVTHDLQEAFIMSDKIGIMLDGRLHQFDTVKNVYNYPASGRVAAFLGHVNHIPAPYFPLLGIDQQGNVVTVRAEAITLAHHENGMGEITEVQFAGHHVIYRVRVKELVLTVYSLDPGFSRKERVDITITHTIANGDH